jgi:hypothetical protein
MTCIFLNSRILTTASPRKGQCITKIFAPLMLFCQPKEKSFDPVYFSYVIFPIKQTTFGISVVIIRDSVLPLEITARVAVEAASSTSCWRPLTLSPQPGNKCCVTLRIMELGMRTFKYDNQSDPTIRQLQHSVNDGAGAALAGRAADCEARYMPRQ